MKMIQLPSMFPGFQEFLYKTYSICVSDRTPQRAAEMPLRVVSIVDHTGKNEPREQDLQFILKSCGINLNMPISRETTRAIGDPT